MKLWAHTLVKNEEKYLWFAVTSVIDFVDKMLLWDTGSTDNTLKIINDLKNIYPNKISFKEVGNVGTESFTKIRQNMLDATNADWLIIVDGDEVWWEDGIRKVIKLINKDGKNLETIVNGYYNLIGDIFHYQNESVGKYKIDEVTGHITIRAVNRNIPGLSFAKPHGQQGLFDGKGVLIQERDKSRRIFIQDKTYLHFTHLIRSSNIYEDKKVIKRNIKYKFELGNSFPVDFFYPESFFYTYPGYIEYPWIPRGMGYFLRGVVETPLKKVKRLLPTNSSGY